VTIAQGFRPLGLQIRRRTTVAQDLDFGAVAVGDALALAGVFFQAVAVLIPGAGNLFRRKAQLEMSDGARQALPQETFTPAGNRFRGDLLSVHDSEALVRR